MDEFAQHCILEPPTLVVLVTEVPVPDRRMMERRETLCGNDALIYAVASGQNGRPVSRLSDLLPGGRKTIKSWVDMCGVSQ